MLKRLASIVVLLAFSFTAGIVVQSCRSGVLPVTVTQPSATPRAATVTAVADAQPHSTATAFTEPTEVSARIPVVPPSATTSANRSVVWLLNGANHAVAVDARTGETLNQTPPLYSYFWFYSAHDARSSYFVGLEQRDAAWHVGLVAIDRVRGDVMPRIALDTFVPVTSNEHDSVGFPELWLSPDVRRVFVILAGRIETKWVTRAYVVDLVLREATSINVFESGSDPWEPVYRTGQSDDGQRLFVAQDFERGFSSDGHKMQSTRVAVLNTVERKVERVVDLLGDSPWSVSTVAPDGRMLYLMQPVLRGYEQVGYGFMGLDVDRGAVEFARQFDNLAGSATGCGTYGMGSTSDQRALWMLCANSVRFLDPQTGRTTEQISLGKGGLDHFNLTYQRLSPDRKLLYVLFTSTNEVYVVDLTRRALVRHAEFKEQKSSLANPLEWLAQQLVNTASAKMVPEPGMVLTQDGQRLYFVDVEGLENGDGVWGAQATTLKPLGHWLKGKAIIGVELSADGRELYAVDWKERKLYVLDAFSGERRRRAFDNVANEPSGFVSTR